MAQILISSRRGGADTTVPDGAFARFLERYLLHPDRVWRDLLAAARRALVNMAPTAIRILIVGLALLVALRVGSRLREARLWQGVRRLRILPPPEVDTAGGVVLWAALHGLVRPRWRARLTGQPYLVWEVSAAAEEVSISVLVPVSVPLGIVERAVTAAWPGAAVIETPAESALPEEGCVRASKLTLARPEWFPLGEGPDSDPLRVALSALASSAEAETAVLQVVATPASSALGTRLRRHYARSLGRAPGIFGLLRARPAPAVRLPRDPTRDAEEREVHRKSAASLYRCEVRIGVAASTQGQARMRAHSLASTFAVFEGANRLEARRLWRGEKTIRRAARTRRNYLLSIDELGRLATIPAVPILGLDAAGARVVAAPRALAVDGRELGVSNASITKRPVAITLTDSRHHMHIVGETGTGKSTLLANMILQDARAGRAAVVIDPKGDLVESVLERLPAGAEDRTCVIDPCDAPSAVGLNVLTGTDPDLVADHLVGLFKRMYENHWGPRSDDLLRASCLTLAKIPGATLAEVPLLLTHGDWRRAIRARLSDPALRLFWELFDAKPEARRQEDIAPLMNKLRAFLLRGSIRGIVGQSAPKQDLEDLLEDRGLLLVRVPKGLIGEDTSKLLGGLIVGRVWQAAMRRARLPEGARTDLCLYVDEVHNYLTLPRSFEDLLAEARGYGLSLVLAHQHLGQLPREMREALAANARTKIVFACSPQDARGLEEHFEPALAAHDLSHLPAYTAACRPCIGGAHGRAFTLTTNPLPDGSPRRAHEARERSREAFAESRGIVEAKIRERHRRPEVTLLPQPEQPLRSVEQSVELSVEHSGERPSLIGAQSPNGSGEAR
jgi:hypothetical protein